MVTRVVPDAELPGALDALAAEVATQAGGSNAAVKQLLLTTYGADYETQLEREGRLIAKCASSADGKEGVGAFVGKRKPAFG